MIRRGELKKYFIIGAVLILLTSTVFVPFVSADIIQIKKPFLQKTQKSEGLFRSRDKTGLIDLFTSTVHTDCAGVKKSTEVVFGITNSIDVDNNPSTGVNGKDVKVQYMLMPVIETGSNLAIGLSFILNFERIGNEIRESDFTASMEIGNNYVRIGFWSPDETNNEIPDSVTVSFTLMFYINEQTRGYKFSLDPNYASAMQEKKLVILSEFNGQDTQTGFEFEFDPAIDINSEIKSSLLAGRWQYNFKRSSLWDSKTTTSFTRNEGGNYKTTRFIIDHLPREISFALDFTPFTNGGGKLEYESTQMYNVELTVESNQMGECKYATVKNTPKKIVASWKPSLTGGYYNANVISGGTEFTLQNDLVSPTKKFILTNLENIDFETTWDFTNPGVFIIEKTSGLNAILELQLEDWTATIDSKFTAEYIDLGWYLGTSGYLKIDTNWEPLTTVDISIMAPDIGLKTVGQSLKAEDFELFWTVWPPAEFDITKNGELDFTSVSIDFFSDGNWYHIWPW